MHTSYQPNDSLGRIRGLVLVGALHLALAWALISASARTGPEILTKPMNAVLIQEVSIPPVPPAPPPAPKDLKPPEPKTPQAQALPAPFVAPAELPSPVAAAATIAAAPPPAAASALVPAQPLADGSPPAAAVPPIAKAPVTKPDIALICPHQVLPVVPSRARQSGAHGVVTAQALVKDGAVREVTILSGPGIFHTAVRNAMLQYACTNNPNEEWATQVFRFE